MPAPGKIRSTQGCWTCRLRRKKCDEQKPNCSICASLEITCLYSDKKPEWMDGGIREKKMSDHLKAMVKAKANERREKKWASEIEVDGHHSEASTATSNDAMLADSMADHTLDSNTDHEMGNSSGPSMYTPGTSATEGSPTAHPSPDDQMARPSLQVFEPVLAESDISGHVDVHIKPHAKKPCPDDESERELNFSMLYLDYVVPYMSPFYRPPLLQGGRGWLLVLLMRNKSLFHTALSLASYFFSVMVNKTMLGHEDCQQRNWSELQKQQRLSIESLQKSLQCLNSHGVANLFHESIRSLECIIQMISFDATIGNAANWNMHLDAACSLFEQIIQHHATDRDQPWQSILAGMDSQSMAIEFGNGQHPWSASQASFRFQTIHLIWTDILASTALNRTPLLEAYHQQLLVGDNPSLQAWDFFGCHNWVLLIISQIAGFQAWKKEMKRARTLSMVELVKKGSCIESRLRAGIAELDQVIMDVPFDPFDPSARAPDQPFLGSGFQTITDFGQQRSSVAQAIHTKIWAKAALTYDAVVVSGFQPGLPDIQNNVAETIELFRALPSPLCLRTMVWPFAVTGCLALPEQEDFFRSMVSNMDGMQVFGTVKEALRIMETVWEHRACMDADLWDITTCFNVLGHASLLV
ncbi:hypothetical protein PFICI_13498 [Pestalotiopsis fici W106-1]|uniref:Zn(2)-C6 fungal-type domain-containing protein n=1 Tax=Pestalotiopsis fici (strain W106-1 / CGMCC3.15140) TaxID=1229662 RepID=W3WMM5_PESFW|nr:uncharacterized protein PFICI_13498 [Pestalotiopsis fici W106-1]ETS75014.1 hypothetical protein PFICI_13498 [Pestalotiopsis fici W106-1]